MKHIKFFFLTCCLFFAAVLAPAAPSMQRNSSISPQPVNGNGEDVYLATLELSGVATGTPITSGSINGTLCADTPDAANGVYGIKDVQTDADKGTSTCPLRVMAARTRKPSG